MNTHPYIVFRRPVPELFPSPGITLPIDFEALNKALEENLQRISERNKPYREAMLRIA